MLKVKHSEIELFFVAVIVIYVVFVFKVGALYTEDDGDDVVVGDGADDMQFCSLGFFNCYRCIDVKYVENGFVYSSIS